MKGVLKRLDEIEARANAAMAGPWVAEMDPAFPRDRIIRNEAGYVSVRDENACHPSRDGCGDADNFAFIAHARTDVPALVKLVRALAPLAEINSLCGCRECDAADAAIAEFAEMGEPTCSTS